MTSELKALAFEGEVTEIVFFVLVLVEVNLVLLVKADAEVFKVERLLATSPRLEISNVFF